MKVDKAGIALGVSTVALIIAIVRCVIAELTKTGGLP